MLKLSIYASAVFSLFVFVSPVLGVEKTSAVVGCDLPAADDSDRVVAFSVEKGLAVSNVAVSGQGEETGIVTINVEKGGKPIYVVALSHDPVIWNIVGEIGRISHFSAIAPNVDMNISSGVIGLKSNILSFHDEEFCSKVVQSGHIVQMETIKRYINRVELMTGSHFVYPELNRIDKNYEYYELLGQHQSNDLNIDPSAPKINAEMYPDYSWAITRMDTLPLHIISTTDVISPSPVEYYEVLPGYWGVMQLVESHDLVPKDLGYGGAAQFQIQPTMKRFPVGLYGGKAAYFELPANVPMPEGNIGHSTVLTETGQVLIGPGN